MRVTLAIVACIVVGSPAQADGIAYRLPPDGTWVVYRSHCTELPEMVQISVGKDKKKVEEKIDLVALKKQSLVDREDLFLVRSVGRIEKPEGASRWIELVNNPTEEGEKKPQTRVIILKLLIGEKYFAPNQDPFAHVEKMYMSDRRPDGELFVTEVKDADRRRYELDRFRPMFPLPAGDAKRTEIAERKSALGTSKGYELDFDYGFEGKLYAGKLGRNSVKGHYRVFVSESAPFGIAEIHESEGRIIEEYSDGSGYRTTGGKGWREVKESGTGAKSGLPDKQ